MSTESKVYEVLSMLNIDYQLLTHPPAPTIEVAKTFWQEIDSTHCKNLFFRNWKGNQHYLVILEWNKDLDTKTLEKELKSGRLSFGSAERLQKFLGLEAGAVSPLGLINDSEKHVIVFLDEELKNAEKLTFHPNINTAAVTFSFSDFEKFLKWTGNSFEFRKLPIL